MALLVSTSVDCRLKKSSKVLFGAMSVFARYLPFEITSERSWQDLTDGKQYQSIHRQPVRYYLSVFEVSFDLTGIRQICADIALW
ncbi:MAG: hypothetical protein WAW80_05185 [Candidatus Saccharimonadales bacterium]